MCAERRTLQNRQRREHQLQHMVPLSDHIVWNSYGSGRNLEKCTNIYIPISIYHCFVELQYVMYRLCAWTQVRDVRAQQQCGANRNNNSPEQFIETVQHKQAALIHFPLPLTRFQGRRGAWADPTEGRKNTLDRFLVPVHKQTYKVKPKGNLEIWNPPDSDTVGGKTDTNTGITCRLHIRESGDKILNLASSRHH